MLRIHPIYLRFDDLTTDRIMADEEDDDTRDISNVLLNGQRVWKGRRRKSDLDD